jgi:biotin transport system ATP-binding protein
MELAAQGLGHRFEDGSWGLKDLSFRLGAGLTVLAGHNGSGKTLLSRHLVGLAAPTEGRVLVDGRPVEGAAGWERTRRRIGYVFQNAEHQILGVTVDEDVAFTPERRGWPRERTLRAREEALAAVGLTGRGEALTAFLSGGEKRRLALASTFVAGPELIILDEPFNDLDWPGVSELLSIVLGLRERGVAILLVTHDLEKCLAHADRLMVMDGGRLVADGAPAELLERFRGIVFPPAPGGKTELASLTWLKEGS